LSIAITPSRVELTGTWSGELVPISVTADGGVPPYTVALVKCGPGLAIWPHVPPPHPERDETDKEVAEASSETESEAEHEATPTMDPTTIFEFEVTGPSQATIRATDAEGQSADCLVVIKGDQS
jgi:hypothetical protein